MTHVMHVHHARLFVENVIVDSRDLDAVVFQLGEHRVDLAFKQHEVTHHHCVIARSLESHPGAEREPRLYWLAVRCDFQVGAWKTDLVNVAFQFAGPANDLIYPLSVELLHCERVFGGADSRNMPGPGLDWHCHYDNSN